MRKYIILKDGSGRRTKKRMVNQDEIVEYLKENPCRKESEIFFDIYNFTRDGFDSNKKYADCLRRALYSGKIERKRVKLKGIDNRYYFRYYVPGFEFVK